MEADWEVEIGPSAPVIDACWPGFVDLRRNVSMAWQLPEAEVLPGLADALGKLNAASTGLWTSKCDVWQISNQEEIDPFELDAPLQESACGWACYIDLLPAEDWAQFSNVSEEAEASLISAALIGCLLWCKRVCKRLADIPLNSCRVDLILREADVEGKYSEIGITMYLTACAGTCQNALLHLGKVLGEIAHHFADGFASEAKVE